MRDPSPNTFEEYLHDKAYPQVKEILTMFPGMVQLWYDVSRRMKPEQSFRFYKIAYDIQPQMLINERVGNGFGDFDIPGGNKIPDDINKITKTWQTAGALNNSWSYISDDNDWKSVKELLYWLVDIVSKGGNYMLDIGPNSKGDVPLEGVVNLMKTGNWLKTNGEIIYGTSKWKITHEGPTNPSMNGTRARAENGFNLSFTPEDFWFTKKWDGLFAIALKYPNKNNGVLVKSLTPQTARIIKDVKILGESGKLQWSQSEKGLKVTLPEKHPNVNGYVLKIIF